MLRTSWLNISNFLWFGHLVAQNIDLIYDPVVCIGSCCNLHSKKSNYCEITFVYDVITGYVLYSMRKIRSISHL